MRLLALASLALCACPVAPRTVDGTVTLDAKTAKVQVTLRDLRAPTKDQLEQFRGFERVVTPKVLVATAPSAKWLGTPSRYAWVARDGGVDLEVATTIPRAVFDDCAKRSCTQNKACDFFPIAQCDGGYALITEKTLEVAPGQATSWALDAGVLSVTAKYVGDPGNTHRIDEVFEATQQDAAAAQSTAKWIDDLTTAFMAGDLAKRAKLEKESDARTDPYSGYRREALHRLQLEVLDHALGTNLVGKKPAWLPKEPLPAEFAAKAAEVAKAAKAPQLRGEQHVSPPADALRALCTPTPKEKISATVCLHALGKPKS